MEAQAEDLLPVEYFHMVFTLPAEIAQTAYWNKKAMYGLLFVTIQIPQRRSTHLESPTKVILYFYQ